MSISSAESACVGWIPNMTSENTTVVRQKKLWRRYRVMGIQVRYEDWNIVEGFVSLYTLNTAALINHELITGSLVQITAFSQ